MNKPMYRTATLAIALATTLVFPLSNSFASNERDVAAQKKKASAQKKPAKSPSKLDSRLGSKSNSKGASSHKASSGKKQNALNSKLTLQKKEINLPKALVPLSTAKKNIGLIKPPRSGEIFRDEGSDERKLEKALDAEILQLFRLTQKYKASPNRGELWLRLAELYVEKSRLLEFRIQNDYDDKLKAWEAKGRKGAAPKVNLQAVNVYNKKAIQLYEWYLADFPKDRRVDQALFFLGYNYFELGQVRKGAAFYEQLTRQFPHSPYIVEASFALGEFYFENEKWTDAHKNYSDALKERNSRVYSFALYKRAWSFYRMGRVKLGMEDLERVIRESKRSQRAAETAGLRSVNRIRLGNEALRDLVIFYADFGDYTEARSYFRKIAGDKYVFEMMERLAYTYSDAGKRDAARHVFQQLLVINPAAPKAFDYQYQVVTNYMAAGKNDVFKDELYKWVEKFGDGSEWRRVNKDNAELLKKADEMRETTLRNYVLSVHQTAQNTRLPHVQGDAKRGYLIYLKYFKDAPQAAEMHFFFGELLYDMKDYDKAGSEYLWVVENAKKSKYYQDSLLNTVLALEKALPSDAEIKKKVGNSNDPLELTDVEKRFETAAQHYVGAFPNSEQTVEIKFKMGRLYYGFNQFDAALNSFQEIVRKYPKSQEAVYSANLILDIYNLKKDYAGLAKVGHELMAVPGLEKTQVESEIKNVVEKAAFKTAQDLEAKKDYVESAKAFESFVKAHPRSSLVSTAQFNSGLNYEKAGQTAPAIKMYALVIGSNSKDAQPLKRKSRELLSRLYERTGQLELAAREFEKLADENTKDKLAPNFYFNAAVIWEAFGKNAAAIKAYEKYFEISRTSQRSEAIFRIAEIHDSQNRLSLAEKGYEQFLVSGSKDEAKIMTSYRKLTAIAKKKGQPDRVESWQKKTIYAQRNFSKNNNQIGVSEAAEAKFNLSLKTFQEMKAQKIPQNPDRQQAVVQNKLALIDRLNKELLQVIQYNDGEYLVASLATLGEAYENLSNAIYLAPLPAGLNADEKKLYQAEIEKIAGPLKQKAIENFKSALAKAQDVGIAGKWASIARDGLGRYKIESHDLLENRVPSMELVEYVED